MMSMISNLNDYLPMNLEIFLRISAVKHSMGLQNVSKCVLVNHFSANKDLDMGLYFLTLDDFLREGECTDTMSLLCVNVPMKALDDFLVPLKFRRRSKVPVFG